MKFLPLALGAVLLFSAGYALHALVPHHLTNGFKFAGIELREKGQYAYVNPLLSCGDVSSPLPSAVQSMEEDVKNYINLQKNSGKLHDAGIYYRDLSNGPWFGIDQETEFSPGSLLKVPLLMSLYRKASVDSTILSKEVEYEGGGSSAEQEFAASDPIVAGKKYKISELAEHMITHSDNNAALLLFQVLGFDVVTETYRDLGLVSPQSGKDYQITVRDYSTFFRLLFNATYLTPADSENALATLARSDFKEGLVAGVPSRTVVAHKFGERRVMGTGELQQLHDCGIVYAPNHPYVLCVMTQGRDIHQLAAIIAEVSRIVYTKSVQ